MKKTSHLSPRLHSRHSRSRALLAYWTIAAILFANGIGVRGQSTSDLKGESIKVNLTPNSTVDAKEIKLKADRDHDGMSDDAEGDNGTDPDNPADADADADNDGLTNGDEVAGGSNLNSSDSDGDGVDDGEEVTLGYDPLDPDSTPPPNASLVSLQVRPSSVNISINTMLGQEPVQLRVTGVRNDGTPVDLTGSPTLNYESFDEGVAFVDGFGNVAGSGAGQTTVRVSTGTVFAETTVLVTFVTPTALSGIDIPGYANNVDVAGNYAYVAAGSAGLVVVDVSDRTAPSVVATLNTPGNANDVRIVGNLVYIADGGGGLRIIDVTTPATPVVIGFLNTPGSAYDVVVYDGRAYIADGGAGVAIVDVSNPSAPALIGAVDTPGIAKGLDVSGNFIAVADNEPANVFIIDASSPASPQIAGSVELPPRQSRS